MKAYRIADNQTSSLSGWDLELLTNEILELAARALQYSTRPGENVLDLFGGSGSTLIAAQQAGRRAFLMELDPPYYDVIVARFEQFTGKKAQRIAAQENAA